METVIRAVIEQRLRRWTGILGMLLAWSLAQGAAAAPAPLAPVIGQKVALPGALPFPTNSPVRLFRALLQADPVEQERLLAGRSAESRAIIRERLQEYRNLTELERETKLRALEFHHIMKLLLSAPESVREVWLTEVPVEYQKLCAARLRLWNVLPPELQRDARERDATFRWLTRYENASEQQRRELLKEVPDSERRAREAALDQWRGMTAAEREQAWRNTRQMFEMSPRDQQRVMATVTESNRAQTAKLVGELRQLTPGEREQRLSGWQRFTQLNPQEQAKLLQAWERWKKMSETERELWRRLSASVPKSSPLPAVPIPSGMKTGALGQPGHGYAVVPRGFGETGQ